MSVRVSLFGATEVWVDDERRPISRLQVRRLLALLAANGDAVSADRLIEHLWPSGLPASPRKALNVVLSRTRAALAPHSEVLATVDDGYRLEGIDVDLRRFERNADAVIRGEADAGGAERCRDWLVNWAQPFADDPEAHEFEALRAELDNARRAATLHLVAEDHDLNTLDVDRLLTRLRDDRPGDEAVGLALAGHLAATGRRDDALRMVASIVRWLQTELGVEPRADWSALERELLESGGAGSGAEPGTASAEPARTERAPLAGRDDVIAQLVASSGPVLVAGEPGIGKSSVLAETAERLRSGRGAPVVVGAASPDPDGPLDPVAAMCADLIAAGANLAGAESALARVCPDLVAGGRSLMGRSEFDRQVAEFVLRSSGAVVIDDAQWLQDAPGAVLIRMIEAGGDRPILIGHNTAHQLPVDVGEALGAARVVELDPLDQTDVVAAIQARGYPEPDDTLATEIHQASGGNSLLVSMLIDDWVEGRWRPGGESAPTVDVRAVVRRRLDELTRNDIDTISLAAVMGAEFRRAVLAQLDANADSAIASGVRAGLLEAGDGTGLVRFRHGLIADELARRVPESRLVSVHDRLHRALRGVGASAIEYFPHALHAVAVDPLGAIEAAVAAAGEHTGSYSWESAADALDQAMSIANDHDADDDLLTELFIRRGAVRRALLDDRYVDDLRAGVAAARRVGRNDLVVTGVTELVSHGATTRTGAVDADLGRLVDSSLELVVAAALRAELCSAAATFYSMTTAADRSRELYSEAIDIARRSGDRALEERILLNAQTGVSHPDDFPQLRAAALRLAEVASCAESRWESAFLRFGTGAVLGDPVEVAASMQTMLDTVEQVEERPRLFGTAFSLAAYDLLRGDVERAEARVDQVIEIGLRSYDPSWVMGIASMMLLSTRSESGTIESLRGAVDGLIEETPEYLAYRAVRAAMAVESADLDLALSDLDLLLADELGGVEREFHWTMVLALASRAAVAVGTPEQRSLLEAELSAHAGQMTWNGVCSAGPVDEMLALLADDPSAAALLTERADRLRQRFDDGLEPIDSSGFDALVSASAVSAHTATS